MRIVFGNWKYILANIWYVLPFAIVPAILLALNLDYHAISAVTAGFFTGEPRMHYLDFFNAWSIVRFDSWLGAIYTIFAFIACVCFITLLLVFVEKHLRIGKRTLSGLLSQFTSLLLPAFVTTLFYLLMFELWAVLFAAVLFAVCSMSSTSFVYVIYVLVVCVFLFALLYLMPVCYLFLPCKLMTGFRAYDAFLYSYRLMTKVRWRLILSLLFSVLAMVIVLAGCSLLPSYIFRIVTAVLFCFFFMSFGVRMLTVYFAADKLDREDVLKSYREL